MQFPRNQTSANDVPQRQSGFPLRHTLVSAAAAVMSRELPQPGASPRIEGKHGE
jgi:hypothetical protein